MPSVLGRVARAQVLGALGEPGDEAVEDVVHHDHPLVGVAGLAGVADPGVPGEVGRRGDVVGVEDDVRVGATELEHALLQVLAGDRGDHRAGPLGAGQRDARDPRVGDDRLDLLVGGEHVDVGALRQPGVLHDLLDRERAPGTDSACLSTIVLPSIRFGAANRAIW